MVSSGNRRTSSQLGGRNFWRVRGNYGREVQKEDRETGVEETEESSEEKKGRLLRTLETEVGFRKWTRV